APVTGDGIISPLSVSTPAHSTNSTLMVNSTHHVFSVDFVRTTAPTSRMSLWVPIPPFLHGPTDSSTAHSMTSASTTEPSPRAKSRPSTGPATGPPRLPQVAST